MTEIQLVEESDKEDFECRVNELIKIGWTPKYESFQQTKGNYIRAYNMIMVKK